MSFILAKTTGGGGGGAFSSITGTPTEVAYFDALGNGTSDSLFTRNLSTGLTKIGADVVSIGDTENTLDGTKFYVDTPNKTASIQGLTLESGQYENLQFIGTGLDDLTLGTVGGGYTIFNGTSPIEYTVTVDGVNIDVISIESSTITGGVFTVGDTITNGLGGIATVNSVVEMQQFGNQVTTYLGVTITAGTFGNGETIDNGSGVTGTGYYILADTFTFTDGTTTFSNIPTLSGMILTYDVVILFSSQTGHTLADEWTFDAVPLKTVGQFAQFDDTQAVVGDVDGIFGKPKTTWDFGSTPKIINDFGTGEGAIVTESVIGQLSLTSLSGDENGIAIRHAFNNPITGIDAFRYVGGDSSIGLTIDIRDDVIDNEITIGDKFDGGNSTRMIIDDVTNEISFNSDSGYLVYSRDISKTDTIVVTSSEIGAMNTTPVPIVVNTDPTKMVQIVDVYAKINSGSTGWTANNTAQVAFASTPTTPVWQNANILVGATAGEIRRFNRSTGSSAELVVSGDGLVLTNIIGDPTGGDTEITVYVTYKLINI